MEDQTIAILLRLIHILAGVFWVGAAFLMAGFIFPIVRETGREGGQFVQHLMARRKLPVFLGIAMGLTILSGLAMYGLLASSTQGAWAGSAPGIGYGVGGLAAILAAVVGMAISGSAGRRMAALGQQAAGSGGLTPQQQGEMARLQARGVLGARITAGLLVIAVGAMAIARYL
jgi:hypothetical protein